MHGSFPARLPNCPYCRSDIASWRRGSWIETCKSCRRPMVLIRSPFDRNGPLRLRGLLDIASHIYGIATIIMVISFVFAGMSPLFFVKLLALLLYLIGSILLTDSVLGLLSRIDRTWGQVRYNGKAHLFSVGKLAAGLIAVMLTIIGLMI